MAGFSRNRFITASLISIIFATSGCVSTSESGFRRVIEHEGKYELVYFGFHVDQPAFYKTLVNKKEIFVSKDAVVPSIQSMFLLEHTRINNDDSVLDIGTGSGVQAIFAAQKASKVVATDINPNSITSAKFNAKFHGLEDIIDVRLGDLFSPVKNGEKFDVIIYNIDYPYNVKNEEIWEVHERFFAQAKKYLKTDATIFYQSGWIWNIPRVLEMIRSNGFLIERILMVSANNHAREPIVYELKSKDSK